MYSNSYCGYKFAPKQEKIGQSSHKEYSNNILKYLEFTAIINACTKKSGNLLNAPRTLNLVICCQKSTFSVLLCSDLI